MKHNLLSVSQMCDQGHKVPFDSQKYEIRKEGSGKMIDTVARTSSNIYVLSEIGNEKCCLGKEDESWIWHKIMGHMHSDNLVKFSRREELEKFPESQNEPTLYASIVNKERKQRQGSNRRNIQ